MARLSSILSILSLKDRALANAREKHGCLLRPQRVTSGENPSGVDYAQTDHRLYVRDPEQTKKLFDKYKPTHVIHLAALGMFLRRSMGQDILK